MSPRPMNVNDRRYTTVGIDSCGRGRSASGKVLPKIGRKVRGDVPTDTMVHQREKLREAKYCAPERARRFQRTKNDGDAAAGMIPGNPITAIAAATTAPLRIDRATAAAPPPLLAPVKIEGGRCHGTRTRQPLDPRGLENRALLSRWTERHHEQRGSNKKAKTVRTTAVNKDAGGHCDEKNALNSEKRDSGSGPLNNSDGIIVRRRLMPIRNRHRMETNDRGKVERLRKRHDNMTYCTKRAGRRRIQTQNSMFANCKNGDVVSINTPPNSDFPEPCDPSESPSSTHGSALYSPTCTHSTSAPFTPDVSSTASVTSSSAVTSTSNLSVSAAAGIPVTSVTHAPFENMKNALDGYDHSRIYLAHVSFFDWRDLPGRRAVDGERIWVVGAADHGGRHRTRLLVTGRHWRPRCLSKVNMVTQPVVYAGGGSGFLTADLFLWWFHREFATTAMAMHPDGAILVAEAADYLPPEVECITADGLVRLLIVPKDCLEPRIVANELRVRLAAGLLTSVRCHPDFGTGSQTIAKGRLNELEERVKRFTLKEAFAELHRAWLGIRSETFARSWILMQEHDDGHGVDCQPTVGAMLSSRSHRDSDSEDGNLIGELKSLAREAGLTVDDSELQMWILDEASEFAKCVTKKEITDDEEPVDSHKINEEDGEPFDFEDNEEAPTAKETVGLLSKVLIWMEREPLDPGLLLAVRSMRETAAMMASKMGLTGTHPSGLPFFCPNGDHLTQPPPAHMGIPPYGALDAGKAAAAAGLTRAPMYPFSTGQYPYPMLSPEMTQVAASWHTPSMYPISPASAGFRSPYPTSLPITSSSLPSDLYRFSPTGLMPPHPGLSPHAHALASHALVSSAPKADHSTLDHNHRSTIDQKNSTSLSSDNTKAQDTGQQNNQDKKKPHIKKPLNAFMLYMKEMRAKVVAECTLKESAAINQILGRRWHALGREEQAKYYELARRERQLHMQLYPDWSSRANTNRTKKRKRKQDTNSDPGGNNMKKCRARYGLDQQSQWCKPCRRKKKCIRYMGEGGDGDGDGDGDGEDDHSEDNLGSVGEAGTPEDDESLSSPGGLSALSSLASPSLVLPSPSSLASPCPCPLTPPVPPPPLSNPNQNPTQGIPAPHRNPVGTNPHDINNPLSVNQLTGQCIKSDVGGAPSGPSNPAISVT